MAALVLLATAGPARAQRVALSGFVKDTGGEPLIGAVVYIQEFGTGVSTNSYGFYSLQVPKGERVVKCAYAGYVTAEITVSLDSPLRHDFCLEEDRTELEAARVFSRSKREEISLPQLGRESVDATLVKKIPALMGEADIIRVIQMMPGVQTPSEGSASGAEGSTRTSS